MMAKPATSAPVRATSTTLSACRMCQMILAAVHAGLRPASINSCDIAATRRASAVRAGCSVYSFRGTGPLACASYSSGKSMKDPLHVLILLQLVDHREHFRGLLFGQLGWHRADVLMLGGEGRDAARFQSFLQLAKVRKGTAYHELGLTFLATALTHFLQSVVDEIELQIILVDAFGIEAENTHLLEEKTDAAVGGEISAPLGDDVAHTCNSPRRIVGRGLHQKRYAVGSIALVQHLVVIRRIAARGAFDRGLDFVLRHIDRA